MWGPGLIQGPSVWNLWWTKWQWDRFHSKCFGFPLSVSFHQWSILTFNSPINNAA
jgi:hypothetical protein